MPVPGETVYIDFETHHPTTRALQNADSAPTGTLWRNGAATAVTATITHPPAGTGKYYGSPVVIPATYAPGDKLGVVVDATVNGLADAIMIGLGPVDRISQTVGRILHGAKAATYFVSAAGSDSNDGKSIEAPKLTIASASTAAAAGDWIYLFPGTYSQGTTPLAIKDGVSVAGAGLGLSIISGSPDFLVDGVLFRP